MGQWNADIQHAFSNSLTMDVAYVGNHGVQAGQLDINQPAVGWGYNGPTLASLGLGGMSAIGYCLNGAGASQGAACFTSKPVTTAIQTTEFTGQAFYSQFPYLQNINQNQDNDWSNYQALQVTVTDRASHGLTFLAGYTLSVARSSNTSNAGMPADVRNLSINYGPSPTDSRNRFTFSATYNVPGIKTPGQMLQGWSVSPIVVAYGAQPWSASDATNDIIGTGELNNTATGFQPWNFSGPASAFNETRSNIPCYGSMSGCTPYSKLSSGTPPAACIAAAQAPYAGNSQLQTLALDALQNIGCYVQNGGVLTPPAYGTIGNAGPGFFRGQAFYNVDLSIAKQWKFRERYSAEFRAEFFNLFNRADFAGPGSTDPSAGGSFGQAVTTPDETGFTNSVLGSGSARSLQFGLKLSF